MSLEHIAGTDLSYYLITYDANGQERGDDEDGVDGLVSRRVLDELAMQGTTDVFVFSHGWKGDIPGAREDYTRWLQAAAACIADIGRLKSRAGGFRQVLV